MNSILSSVEGIKVIHRGGGVGVLQYIILYVSTYIILH